MFLKDHGLEFLQTLYVYKLPGGLQVCIVLVVSDLYSEKITLIERYESNGHLLCLFRGWAKRKNSA